MRFRRCGRLAVRDASAHYAFPERSVKIAEPQAIEVDDVIFEAV